ncbi:MAG: hypothetical protein RIF33_26495 [Cyclobacteriaceae bacterium]
MLSLFVDKVIRTYRNSRGSNHENPSLTQNPSPAKRNQNPEWDIAVQHPHRIIKLYSQTLDIKNLPTSDKPLKRFSMKASIALGLNPGLWMPKK